MFPVQLLDVQQLFKRSHLLTTSYLPPPPPQATLVTYLNHCSPLTHISISALYDISYIWSSLIGASLVLITSLICSCLWSSQVKSLEVSCGNNFTCNPPGHQPIGCRTDCTRNLRNGEEKQASESLYLDHILSTKVSSASTSTTTSGNTSKRTSLASRSSFGGEADKQP